MVSQLKPLHLTPVSSVELFSQLMAQENTPDVLAAPMKADFKLASILLTSSSTQQGPHCFLFQRLVQVSKIKCCFESLVQFPIQAYAG